MNCVTSGIIRIFLCVALCASIIQAFGLGIVHQRSSQLFKTQNGLQTRFKLHPSIISSQYRRSTFQPHMAVDSVTLESLSNYEEDGTWLAKAVQVALDEEWLPQKVHEEIGDRVKNIYIEKRQEGELEVTGILVAVGTELEKVDLHPAFVGSWDIANMVSDFLVVKLGGDDCGCSNKLPESLKGEL